MYKERRYYEKEVVEKNGRVNVIKFFGCWN